jgi:hypothetical protein
MKKLISATAVCALAVGLVAVPSALGVKSTKQVASSVTVNVVPTTVVAGGSVTASGNVSSNSSCRKDRTVSLQWLDSLSAPVGSPTTTTTKSNGSYSTTVTAPATAGTYTLQATVQGPVIRKVGGKKKGQRTKKGRQFSCNASAPTSSSPETVTPAV